MLRHLLILSICISANVFAQNSFILKPKNTAFSTNGNGTVWNAEGPEIKSSLTFFDSTSPEELTASTAITLDGGCKKDQSFTMSTQQRKNIVQLSTPITEFQCNEAEKFKETRILNQDTCMLLANCFKSRVSLSNSNRQEVLKKAREKTAAEAVSLIAPTTIDILSELEELKSYASQKYNADFLPEECTNVDSLSIPDSKDSFCMTEIIDRGYEIAQNNCRNVDIGCNREYLDFIEGKDTVNGQSSLMSEYIKKKSNEKAKAFRQSDSSVTREIAEIMSNTFKSPEDISDDVLKYLLRNELRLDPIYKSYIRQSEKSRINKTTDEFKEGLVKYISANRGKRAPEIVIELDMLRKKEAKAKLATDCTRVMSLPKLCKVVHDVLEGAEVQVPRKAFDKMVKGEGFSAMHPKLTNQDLADNVSRCNIFSVERGLSKLGILERLSGGLNLFSSGEDGIFIAKEGVASQSSLLTTSREFGMRPQIIVKENGEITKKEMNNSFSVERLNSTGDLKISDTVFANSFSKNRVMQDPVRTEVTVKPPTVNQALDKVESIDSLKVSAVRDEAGKTNNTRDLDTRMASSSQFQSSQSNTFIPKNLFPNTIKAADISASESSEVIDKKSFTDKPKQNLDYTNLITKISGLEEKLAAAQKKSAQVVETTNTDARAAEESELARELRLAKASLADISRSNAEAKIKENASSSSATVTGAKPVAQVSSAKDDGEDIVAVAGSTSKDIRSGATAAVAAPASSGASSVGASSGSGVSETRGPGSVGSSETLGHTGAATSGASGEFSIGEGIVLTRLDGISRSKASETISKMIIADSGKPFFIEEGGFVKEIIPEVIDGVVLKNEDGTPVYKTVVKGKVGEFKIETKGKSAVKDLPAKVASPADVKIQDYKKINVPVVRYSDLQEVFKPKGK